MQMERLYAVASYCFQQFDSSTRRAFPSTETKGEIKMVIGIISDTHGYFPRVQLAMEKFFADADLIVHAGDV